MAEKKIEDFGEKIGGARKDLYALNRELRYGDILDWNDMEKEKYITKKEAFPLPDYKKMLEEGKDREVIFFIKKVRDSLPTKPLAAIPVSYTHLDVYKRQGTEFGSSIQYNRQ